MIVKQVEIEGSGKGTSGWFGLRQANVSYDHPFNAPPEHALNIDFMNEAQGPAPESRWNSVWSRRELWSRLSLRYWTGRRRVDSWRGGLTCTCRRRDEGGTLSAG